MRSLLAVWNSLQILYCKRWTRTARPERGFLFRLYLCSVMLGRAGYATRCCNIKWLSQNQQYMLSSSLHIFSPWTHKLIVCMLHCFSLPLMSLFPLPFLSPFSHSFLFPSFLFPSLPFSHILLLFPFTEAIVVINCTKEDYDSFESVLKWSVEQTIPLIVGNVITDVKLVCSSQ